MKDRFGRTIAIGWGRHEIIWLEAVLTLPRSQVKRALSDIAEMSGRTFKATQSKFYHVRQQARREAAEAQRLRDLAIVLRNPAAFPGPSESALIARRQVAA